MTRPTLLKLIIGVSEVADCGPMTWALGLNASGTGLLITLPFNHDQRIIYLPGRTVHHAPATYWGSAKTDAKEAAFIPDRPRMPHDLAPIHFPD